MYLSMYLFFPFHSMHPDPAVSSVRPHRTEYSISHSPKCLRRVSLFDELNCHTIHGLLAIGGPEDRLILEKPPDRSYISGPLNRHGSGHVESDRIALALPRSLSLSMNNDMHLTVRRNQV